MSLALGIAAVIMPLFSASGSKTYKGPRRASLVKSAVFFPV
jgi:hypothetical protein